MVQNNECIIYEEVVGSIYFSMEENRDGKLLKRYINSRI